MTAALDDQSAYITDRMAVFIIGVVGLLFLLMLVAFHSPLISLKAGVMNLLSVGAAYGVMTLVAQGGAVGELIGIVVRCRWRRSFREEYLKDGDTRRAVADGLAKTARVITAAAAIMVVVFLAFIAAPDVFLKLFGIGLATAVLLDATIVRMVLVPAVMQLLGDRNWWIPNWPSGGSRACTSSPRSAPREDGRHGRRPERGARLYTDVLGFIKKTVVPLGEPAG